MSILTSRGAGVVAGGFALLALLLIGAPEAAAQSQSATFAVSYTEVANDCGDNAMTLRAGEVTLEQGAKDITVRVPGVPPMSGTQSARGKFKAQARGDSKRPGIKARYSASGKVAKGALQMVFIAEYYQGKRPLCTQSWSAQGTRK